MKTTTTLTMKSTRRNRETTIEDSYSTRVKIAITPPAGQTYSPREMDMAAKQAAIAAYELATAYLRALPVGCSYCMPDVQGGEAWTESAVAFVNIEHDGDQTAIATLLRVVEQARK